jgi:hypothetical protein
MQRVLVSFVIGVHGLAHLIGFLIGWRLLHLRDLPGAGALGALDLGDRDARALGWLVAAALLLAASLGVAAHAGWALPVAGAAAALSLALCLTVVPRIDAPVGVDLLILLAVLYRHGAGALLLPFP